LFKVTSVVSGWDPGKSITFDMKSGSERKVLAVTAI
jgi:hypothetical protein